MRSALYFFASRGSSDRCVSGMIYIFSQSLLGLGGHHEKGYVFVLIFHRGIF